MSITLKILEPGLGLQDRSGYMRLMRPPTWSASRGQRWAASITLIVAAGDSYVPDVGWPVYIYNTVAGVTQRVFAGTIDSIESEWIGNNGWHQHVLTCVSLWQCLDSIQLEPQAFFNTSAGTIVTTLMGQYPALPIALGTVSAGSIIVSLVISRDTRLSDVIQQMATASGFICDIDPAPSTPQLYFHAPTLVASPFVLSSDELLWETGKYRKTRSDFRDRQIVKASFAAFTPSTDVFLGNGTKTNFTLRYPLDHIVDAQTTTALQPTATGTFTGQPTAGDTVTINQLQYTFVAALDNRLFGQVLIGASYAATAQNLVDAINATPSLQGVTYSLPTWENSLCNANAASAGVFTIYGKSPGGNASNLPLAESTTNFAWSVPPPPGGVPSPSDPVLSYIARFGPDLNNLGTGTVTINGITYTLVATLNNAIPYQIINTYLYSLSDAINAEPSQSGVTYSSATPGPHPDFRTDGIAYPFFLSTSPDGGGVVIYQDFHLLRISTTTPALSSASLVQLLTTSGTAVIPTTTGTGLVPGTVGTVSVSDILTNTGSTLIQAKTAPANGVYLVINYYRLGADCIAVEDSALVATRATAESGTGRQDQVINDTQNASAFAALSEAQYALASYSIFSKEFTFETDRPGLLPGQLLTVGLVNPTGASIFFNGTWTLQDLNATMIPGTTTTKNQMDPLSAGAFFRYRVSAISTTQVQTITQFWEKLALTGSGGSSGGASGAALSLDPGGGGGTGGGGGGISLPINESDVTNLVSDLALKAPLASPALTGVPTAPTAPTGTNTTQIATTAFVETEIGPGGPGDYFPWGGDSSDGAITFDGTATFTSFATTTGSAPNRVYTLTRDVCASSLTINAGITVILSNYAIFARGVVTVNGTVHNDGQLGINGANAGSSTGGGGGGAGIRTSSAFGNAGHYGLLLQPAVGTAGGNGGTTTGTQAGVASIGGSVAATPVDGSGVPGATGSSGGKGGTGTGGAGGAARTGGTAGAVFASGNWQIGRMAAVAVSGIAFNITSTTGTAHTVQPSNAGNGGAAGGSGGGGDTTNAGGGGGGGGGEGGSGGVTAIFAYTITVGAGGTIRANGGNGGNGGNGRTQTVGNVGGGGGGGGGSGGVGGLVWLIYHRYTNAGTVQAVGGTHGTGGTKGSPHGTGTDDAANGANGSDGPAGNVVTILC